VAHCDDSPSELAHVVSILVELDDRVWNSSDCKVDVVMLVADAVLIAMRWQESRNMFVLIFASASTVLFILGKILFAVIQNKS